MRTYVARQQDAFAGVARARHLGAAPHGCAMPAPASWSTTPIVGITDPKRRPRPLVSSP